MTEYHRRYYQEHKAEINERCKRYYQAHKAEQKERCKQYKLLHKVVKPARYWERRAQLKVEVLTHYGDGSCACVKCSFEDIRALSIDHINGNGTAHRRSTAGGGGRMFYAWLKRNNFPQGYQTLCMNCQFIKKFENREFAGVPKKERG